MIKRIRVDRPDLTPPYGRDFFAREQEAGASPVFSTKEVAKIFFGKGRLWLAKKLPKELAEIDATITRNEDKRQYQLLDVEKIAHVLFKRGTIDLMHFENCLQIIKAIASNYRLL